ncbi:MAG: helix-turn-helix transcriptional regulator [Clostridia bacterium]|nr:helix-turn-helix transcriptional regulator [Clostridia bacterium]
MNNIYKNEDSLIFQNTFFDFDTGRLISPIQTQNYTVVQVAESFYRNKFIIERHKQYCDIELTFPLTNGLVCGSNGSEQKVSKNEIYISFKGEYHSLSARQSCRFQTLALNFNNSDNNELFCRIKNKYLNSPRVVCSGVADHFSDIVSEFLYTDAAFLKSSLDSLITLILIKLARGGTKQKQDVLSADEKLTGIINYIDAHFLDICSLEELSARFGYSYTHICKLFTKAYLVTPKEHLTLKRMAYAAELLKKGKSVNSVSEILGYSTPYNFSRAFKNVFKMSPSSFKNEAENAGKNNFE